VSAASRTDAEWFALADQALATGRHAAGTIDGRRIVAIPDVLAAEFAANGEPHTSSWRLERDDGRTVHLYTVPAGVAL